MAGFTSAKQSVWSAGSRNIMQIEFYRPRTTGHGHCFDSKNSKPEVKRAGLNGNSNNHEDGDLIGWKNEATPSEGAKRRHEAHFISKLTDCDGLRLVKTYGSESENSETDSSLDFTKDCGYITAEQHIELTSLCHEIGKMLGSMIRNPVPFLISEL
jgi:four helix bundle protein